ncbi:MAG: DNA polymerase III subunit delta' [Selenomonadaceae bacterium]|nr:DNA polymerase III subunit delta' [Selenomonadaceae bacterium]
MDWTDIIGHEEIIKRLRTIVANDQFPHAVIFSGARGIGKHTLARITAAALLCESSDAPCGHCQSCKAIRVGTHPDLFEIEPDTSAKQPVIKIGQIRQLLAGIALAPVISNMRVIIIDDAHLMNGISQNSILKTIEEPVGRSAFILVTDRRSELLITLRSRCMTLTFDRLTVEQIVEGLRARGIDEPNKIASLADGSLGRALQLSQEGGLEMRADVFNLINRIERMSVEEIFALTEELGKRPRSFVADWLVCFQKFMRDLLVVDTDAQLYNADLRDELSAQRQLLSERSIFEFFDRALETQRRLASNADLRLICDSFLLNLKRSV